MAGQIIVARQKNILGDPDRVRHIKNRGKDIFHTLSHTSQHHLQTQIPEPIPGDINEIHRTIEVELDRSQVLSAIGRDKRYVPRDKLHDILTIERVRTIVDLPCFGEFTDKNKLTMLIYYGSVDLQPRLKLLAVFIGIEKLEDFPKCIKEGMNDQCLPMTVDNTDDGQMSLFCQHHKTHHETINEYRRPSHRTQFTQWSYSLIAPYITSTKRKHSHYHLHASDIFPMPFGRKLQRQEMTVQDNKTQIKETAFAYGGFSEVYQVKIDKSHQNFKDIGVRSRDPLTILWMARLIPY